MYPDAMRYVEFIEAVWDGAIEADVDQINDDVAAITNTVFLSIQKCSSRLFVVDTFFSLFWETTSFVELCIKLAISTTAGTISGWIAYILGYAEYRSCVLVAAVNWKSVMALALLGLAKKSEKEIVEYLKAHPELGGTTEKEIEEVLNRLNQVKSQKE